MAQGVCDCCGKSEVLYPVGVPIAVEPEKFTRLYFMCKKCIGKIPETSALLQNLEATRDMKSAYADWSEEND